MKNGHTPGPWLRDEYGNVVAASGGRVAFRSVTTVCSGTEERIAEAEANTTLAAAAPQLLLALEDAEEILRGALGEVASVRSRVDAYARLIAKARGTA